MSADPNYVRKRGVSIATLVVIALVTGITLVLGGFAVVNYRTEQNAGWEQLITQTKVNADQLAAALALPVWNLDRAQIDRVIDSTMKDPIDAGIRLQLEG